MTIPNSELINQVAAILGSASDATITEYVKWHISSAITWILISCVGGYVLNMWKTSGQWEGWAVVVKTSLGCILVVIIGAHVPDLFSPKAIAIHQLLSDLR